jgi:hypothetical protein
MQLWYLKVRRRQDLRKLRSGDGLRDGFADRRKGCGVIEHDLPSATVDAEVFPEFDQVC